MLVPVVGIGASAGGLEAGKLLLANLPANTGLAFVFVQHLDPKHHSDLTEILAKVSAIPVRVAADGIAIEPDHLYVTPPDGDLEIANQFLRMTPRDAAPPAPRMPIDRFLRSLAHERSSRAIGVILSGSGADGASGLEAVKAAGGVTLAQDPATARFSSMPQAAIRRGCVDFVLPPEGIAAELATLGYHRPESQTELSAPHRDLLIGIPGSFRFLLRTGIVRELEDSGLPAPPPQTPGPRADPRLGAGLRYRGGGVLYRHHAIRIPDCDRRVLSRPDLRVGSQRAGDREGAPRQIPGEYFVGHFRGTSEPVFHQD